MEHICNTRSMKNAWIIYGLESVLKFNELKAKIEKRRGKCISFWVEQGYTALGKHG